MEEAKWENPKELEPELELQLGPDLGSKSGPAVDDPELDLEQLGDEGKECSKTKPVGQCNQKLNPSKASLKDENDPATEEEKLEEGGPMDNPEDASANS